MANTSPSPATCQSNFEQGVALALHLWPALTLAVQNSWGGPDSSDKRDWFAGAVVDLFPDVSRLTAAQLAQRQQQQAQLQSQTQAQSQSHTAQNGSSSSVDEPDQEDVEAVLLQVMLDEFEVNVDDDSAYEVAEQVVRVRAECLRGRFDEVEALRRRWESKKGNKVVFKKAEDQDDDTDWDTDDGEDDDEAGDGDVEMGDAPPPAAPARREKEEPEVDEDGFTKVSRRKR